MSIPLSGQWNHHFGGSNDDNPRKAVTDSLGNIYICGTTISTDYDVNLSHTPPEAWLLKLSPSGEKIWLKTYGGNGADGFNDLLIDGSKIYCIGYTTSDSGDIVYNHGDNDAWLAVMDTAGHLLFDSCYGGQQAQRAVSILKIQNGFLIGGFSQYDSTGQVSNSHGSKDFWLIRVDSLGHLLQQSCFGSTGSEQLYSLAVNTNGDILMGGITANPGSSFSNFHGGLNDGALIIVDSNWNVIQQLCYGEQMSETIKTIYVHSLDTIFLAGDIFSNNINSHGGKEGIIWQIDRVGNMSKMIFYGGPAYDEIESILPASDSSLFFIGSSESYTPTVGNNYGDYDVWVAQIDLNLNLLSSNCYGGTNKDFGLSLLARDSAVTLIARSKSSDALVPANYGNYDLWVLDTVFTNNSIGFSGAQNHQSVDILPNPAYRYLTIHSEQPLKAIKIFDLNGQYIQTIDTKYTTATIDISTLEPGMYLLLSIDIQGYTTIKKWVKI